MRSVAVSHDGRVAVSGADDGTLRTWDLDSLEPISTAQGTWIGVWCEVAVTAGGTVMSSTDNGVQVRDLSGVHQLGDDHQVGKVVALATGAAGRLVVCGLEDGSLHAWDPAGAPPGAPIGRLGNAVRSMALSGDDRLAAVSAVDGTLTLWDLTAGAGDLVRHSEPVKAVAVSHDGRVAVSGCGGDLLKVWEAGLPAPRTTFDGYEARALRMGADGRRVLVSADSVTVLDVERGTVVSQLEHDFTLWPPAALAASGGLVGLSAVKDGTVTVWDADRLEQLGTLEGHGHKVTALAVAPGGRLAACATNDGLVRLWDTRTTTVVASFTTDVRATVLAVADTGPFAVVAGDASGAVHLLELVSPG